jgi:hypothetical protein
MRGREDDRMRYSRIPLRERPRHELFCEAPRSQLLGDRRQLIPDPSMRRVVGEARMPPH